MAFTGQVLRFDQDAYWGLGIGASITARTPVIGPYAVHLLLGGPIIAGATLSRFFALHVFVIPGLLIGFVSLHLLMVLKLGINEWPMPGRLIRRSTYVQEYHEDNTKDGMPFVPVAVWKDAFFSADDHLRDHRLRCVLWTVRSERLSRSDHHSDHSQARLLLPLALRHAGAAAAVDGDACCC